MIPKKRKPTHHGEILREEFLIPMGLSQVALAEKMGVPVQRINTLVNGKRACIPTSRDVVSARRRDMTA